MAVVPFSAVGAQVEDEFVVEVDDPGDPPELTQGTLRYAVEEEASDADKPVRIVFDTDDGSGETVQLEQGEVVYNGNQPLVFEGGGWTIDAQGESRILTSPNETAPIVVEGLTLRNGVALAEEGDDGDELNANGGAILAAGDVTVEDSVVENNLAESEGSFLEPAPEPLRHARGGAIVADGDVTISASAFYENRAITGSTLTGAGGAVSAGGDVQIQDSVLNGNETGILGSAGAVEAEGRGVIGDSEFQGNQAGNGGAVVATAIRVERTLFEGNEANDLWGGAISSATATILETAFVGNDATRTGGAIRLHGTGEHAIVNSTFSQNSVGNDELDGQGSAVTLSATGEDQAGRLSLSHVTMASNEGDSQLRVETDTATVEVFASVISDAIQGTGCDISTAVDSSYGYDTDGSCGFDGEGDVSGGDDPQLKALGEHGGPTPTLPPESESPLVDALDGDDCSDEVTTDQRGEARPGRQGCDIGAVELQGASAGPSSQVQRNEGGNRFETAALLSAGNFEPGVDVAYVASGLDFPDALAGGVAAGVAGAPLLLAAGDEIPTAIAEELQRLQPQEIVVLGGESAITAEAEAALGDFTEGEVSRLAGAERFATAAKVSQANFDTADTVYIGTGLEFPDGLAAAPAAVQASGPLLLSAQDDLPEATRAELERLGPEQVVIVGGTGVVGESVESELNEVAAVRRHGGSQRFDTARRVASDLEAPDEAYVATGLDFADALAAGAVAGAANAPVLLTTAEELPGATIEALEAIRPATITVMGGESAVSSSVETELSRYIEERTSS